MIWTEEGYLVAHTDHQGISVVLRRRGSIMAQELTETFFIHVPKPEAVVEVVTNGVDSNCVCWGCKEGWGDDIVFDLFNMNRRWNCKRRHFIIWDRQKRSDRMGRSWGQRSIVRGNHNVSHHAYQNP